MKYMQFLSLAMLNREKFQISKIKIFITLVLLVFRQLNSEVISPQLLLQTYWNLEAVSDLDNLCEFLKLSRYLQQVTQWKGKKIHLWLTFLRMFVEQSLSGCHMTRQAIWKGHRIIPLWLLMLFMSQFIISILFSLITRNMSNELDMLQSSEL